MDNRHPTQVDDAGGRLGGLIQVVLDRSAIATSGLCVVHCLLTPIMLATGLLPALAFMGEESFHRILFAAILPVSAMALAIGYIRSRDGLLILSGAAGLLLLAVGARAGETLFGKAVERGTTVAGILLVAFVYWRNLRGRFG